MIRRAIAKSAPRPVRPKPPPRRTAAELDETSIRMLIQVERIQAANVWNNRLATEFEEAEAEMDVVETALSLETFPAEVLRRIIAELKEEVLLIVEDHRRLRIEVSELELGAASLKGLVSGLLEAIKLINDSSSALGELLEQLQQELADACVEFETRMISMAHVTAPAIEPTVEPVECSAKSPVETPAVASSTSPPLDPVLDPVPLDLVLGPVPLDPALDPALDPVLDPHPPVPPDPVDLRSPASVLDPDLDPVALDPDLDPAVPGPVLDPSPPVPPDPIDLRSPAPALDPDLDPVVLNPVLDSPALDPTLDPCPAPSRAPPCALTRTDIDLVDLSFDLDLCDPDPEPHSLWSRSRSPTPSPVGSGPVPEPCCSPVFGPAIGQLAPVKKPPDEISVDSASSAPDPQLDLRFRPPDPIDVATPAPKSLPQPEPRSVTRCASQRPPVPLSAAQHLSAPAPACLSVCLFGPPFCDYVARDDAHHRPRLRSSRRRLRPAQKPPGGNSYRLHRLRQRSQKPPKNKFFCLSRLPASKSCPPATRPRRPPDRRRRERLRLDLRPPDQYSAPYYDPLPQSFR
jgi:hypothetical protein